MMQERFFFCVVQVPWPGCGDLMKASSTQGMSARPARTVHLRRHWYGQIGTVKYGDAAPFASRLVHPTRQAVLSAYRSSIALKCCLTIGHSGSLTE